MAYWNRAKAQRFYWGLGGFYTAENLWRTVLLWQILVITHSPLWLAIAVALDTAPTVLVGFTGPSWGGKESLSAWLVIEAGIMTVGGIWGMHSAPILVVVAAINGWYSARIIPLSQSQMMQAVPKDRVTTASSRYEISSRIGIVAGPLIAGGLLATWGGSITMFTVTGILALSSGLWTFLSSETAIDAKSSSTPFRLREAILTVRHDAFLGTALGVRAVANLSWPAFTLAIPLMTLTVWHAHAIGYGLFRSVWGISTIIGTLALIPWLTRHLNVAYFFSWLLTGFGFLIIGMSSTYLLALGMTVIAALGSPLVHVALDTHIGQNIPPRQQSHLFALQRFIMAIVNLLGLGMVSWALKSQKPTMVLEAAGLFMMAAALWGLTRWNRHKAYLPSHTSPPTRSADTSSDI